MRHLTLCNVSSCATSHFATAHSLLLLDANCQRVNVSHRKRRQEKAPGRQGQQHGIQMVEVEEESNDDPASELDMLARVA